MYEAVAKASVDKLVYSINEQDYEKFTDLMEKIRTTVQKICEVKKEYVDLIFEGLGKTQALELMKNGESTPELTKLCILQFM